MIVDRKDTETSYIDIYSNVCETDCLCSQYKLMGQLLVLWTQSALQKIRVEYTLFPPPQLILRAVFGDRYNRV